MSAAKSASDGLPWLAGSQEAGAHKLQILAPDLLELELWQLKDSVEEQLPLWNFTDEDFRILLNDSKIVVQAGDKVIPLQSAGFKRRAAYAPLAWRELRVVSSLYLKLDDRIDEGVAVTVLNPGGLLWPPGFSFGAVADPMRYNPALHVNQEGYMPGLPKVAKIGYFLGSMGEMTVSVDAGFYIIEAESGREVFHGDLQLRPDQGYNYTPLPYQAVLEADFSSFAEPGRYRLVVPGLGTSRSFRIDEGIAMNFTRAYALGLYHQRCGMENALPYTRFTHDACHTAHADIPMPMESFVFTWSRLKKISGNQQLYPFVNTGSVDVSGGHHDAGDYSKYTINSAKLVHTLIFAVDSLAGVADLDNLGQPESGDGISDLLQTAKWEADFLAKMQDADGGFYFLVYPRDRAYENDVLPDHGDPQVVWPGNTAATAAAVAALAQAASSAALKDAYPAAAAGYLEKAKLGWRFLLNAIRMQGKDGAYQKLTHYGDIFQHNDELAWAATEMFLATGDERCHEKLLEWFDPEDPDTRRWGWWRLSESYGNSIRSYAFAASSGRQPVTRLNQNMLAKCKAEIDAAGRDVLLRSDQSAYGTSFPVETKRVRGGGWYFSLDQAFDLIVAHQLNYSGDQELQDEFMKAFVANLNYETGTNPVNVSYITGMGKVRQSEIVHQYAQNDRRVLPPSGIPVGNIQTGQPFLDPYKDELRNLSFPEDAAEVAPYSYYDRWSDTFNVSTEFTIVNQARALAGVAYLAARSELRNQPWRAAPAGIKGVPAVAVREGTPVTVEFEAPEGLDVANAEIVWEARDQQPSAGSVFTFIPAGGGDYWVEVEARWPDGRRVFGTAEFEVQLPDQVLVYSDDKDTPTKGSGSAK